MEEADAPPVNKDVPYVEVQGGADPIVGSTLTCTLGNWENMESGNYTFAWNRDGTAIDGAENETYLLAAEDAGTTSTCIVTATNSLGSVAAPPSNSVAVLAQAKEAKKEEPKKEEHKKEEVKEHRP